MMPEKYHQYVDDYNKDPYGKTYVPAENNSIKATNFPTGGTFRADATFGGVGNYPYGYKQSVNMNSGKPFTIIKKK